MKPHSIYQVRSDGVHLICISCMTKNEGEKYCEENNKDFSHGLCENCQKIPAKEGDVFPLAIDQIKPVVAVAGKPFQSAGFILRHKIETSEDMEKFLNGDL